MEKKKYIKPVAKMIISEPTEVLAGSGYSGGVWWKDNFGNFKGDGDKWYHADGTPFPEYSEKDADEAWAAGRHYGAKQGIWEE